VDYDGRPSSQWKFNRLQAEFPKHRIRELVPLKGTQGGYQGKIAHAVVPAGREEESLIYSRLKTGHQCFPHGRRRAFNLRAIMFLMPLGPWAAHIVPFGAIRAIPIEQCFS
jgi:hypothetical protein